MALLHSFHYLLWFGTWWHNRTNGKYFILLVGVVIQKITSVTKNSQTLRYLDRFEHWLWDWWIPVSIRNSATVLFVKAAQYMQTTRPVQFLRVNTLIETAWYLMVTLDTQPGTCQTSGKEADEKVGVLGPSSTGVIGLSDSVLLCKQLICPVIDYACPIWRSAAGTSDWKLQVLQSKCLSVATNAPWCVCWWLKFTRFYAFPSLLTTSDH
jgi:hypothetical protein